MHNAFTDYGELLVNYYPTVCPKKNSPKDTEGRIAEYEAGQTNDTEIRLRDFLSLGKMHLDDLKEIWAARDKSVRQTLKRRKLGAASISCVLTTRDSEIRLSEKMKTYNRVIALDFDNISNLNDAKRQLSALPYVWYVGLSASSQGLFAIVPLENEDYRMHEVYFLALCKVMEAIGLHPDRQCKDVTRLRYISYDPEPYFNENCVRFRLPEDFDVESARFEAEKSGKFHENPEFAKAKVYADEWAKKGPALDDYGDWMHVGMALSNLGEDGRELFHQVSGTSAKYDRKKTDKAFDAFVKSTRSVKMGTFYYMCNRMGVMPASVSTVEPVEFPVHVFHESIREIIGETKKCLNFTVDHIAASMLFVASVAIGNSIIVEIKNEWVDKAILYVALVGKPGTNKSAPLRYALKPLLDRDRAALQEYEEQWAKYEAALKSQARNRCDIPEEPQYNQIVLSDFTTEVLMRQHKINQRGLAVYVDELIGFIKCFNKYRSGNDEQMWTQMFNGGSVIVNRVSSQPLNIEDTFVGVIGTIQPGLLTEFAKGKTESGFVDRWLFAYPDENVYPKLNGEELDSKYTHRWSCIIEELFTPLYTPDAPPYRLNAEALALYTGWFNALADRKNTASASFAEMATKMERYCIRFAIVLEALNAACNFEVVREISAESIKGGIDLCYYFMGCAMKARKRFNRNPVEELNERQKRIYQELPVSFSTQEGLEIACAAGSCERAFKEWLKTDFFIHTSHGQYEKRYK